MFRGADKDDGRMHSYLCENPYDSFMKKHLQHYGYYTGKNELYRKTLEQWEDYEKNFAVNDSGGSSDSEFVNEALKTDKDRNEDLLRTTQVVYLRQDGRTVPRLREPPELFAIESGPQQPCKWPVELEVLPEPVLHISYVPDAPEPLYSSTGFEPTPMAKTEENGGRVVFDYEPLLGPFFISSRVGGSRKGCREVTVPLESPEDQTLLFESRFESGNLERAIQTGPYEYDLYLRNDLYTNKHTQWYYFRVSNTRANRMYRFTIVNLYKSDSLYNDGMRPLMYSVRDAEDRKLGWRRWGGNIKYYRNNLKYDTGRGERSFYSLTWTCVLPYDKDTVYFAHCYPYTYSDLQNYLCRLSNDPVRSRLCKTRILCRTLAGNLVYLLTITSEAPNAEEARAKRAVVLSSRVHPGETNASWMMKGFLDYLTGPSPDAKLLRDNFVFKIVPMLNPDGVIVGNYRCSLAGRDLNRNYKSVLKESFPSVWNIKLMIKKLLQEREVVMYCDLHGHSRKQNVFIYGCEPREPNSSQRLQERVFPAMLSKNAPDKFCFESCKFKVQKSKEGTGRVVMWNMGIQNSFTMEATFCGSNLTDKDGYHFCSSDFEAMGYHFCDTLLDFCDPVDTKSNIIVRELEDRLKHEILIRLQQRRASATLADINLDNIDLSDDDLSDVESSDGGSDSSVSDGLPVHYEYMKAQFPPQKKKKKTKKDLDSTKRKADSRENGHSHQGRKCQACSQPVPTPLPGAKESRPVTNKRPPFRRAASTTAMATGGSQVAPTPAPVERQPPPQPPQPPQPPPPPKTNPPTNGLTDQLVRKVEEAEDASKNGRQARAASQGPGRVPLKYSYTPVQQHQQHQQTPVPRASGFTGPEPTVLTGNESLCAHHEHQLVQQLSAQQELIRQASDLGATATPAATAVLPAAALITATAIVPPQPQAAPAPAPATAAAAAPAPAPAEVPRPVLVQRQGSGRMLGASPAAPEPPGRARTRIDPSLPSRMTPTEAVLRTVPVAREKKTGPGPQGATVRSNPADRKGQEKTPPTMAASQFGATRRSSQPEVPARSTGAARRASEELQLTGDPDSPLKTVAMEPKGEPLRCQPDRRPSVAQVARENRDDGPEMAGTLASIREVRHSLSRSDTARTISPNTRHHVEQLLAAADRELEQINAGATNVEASLQRSGYKFSTPVGRSEAPAAPVAPLAALPPESASPYVPAAPATAPALPEPRCESQPLSEAAKILTPRSLSRPVTRSDFAGEGDLDCPSLGAIGCRPAEDEMALRSKKMLEQLRGSRRSNSQLQTKVKGGRKSKTQEIGKEEGSRQRQAQADLCELGVPTKISLVMDDRFGRSSALAPGASNPSAPRPPPRPALLTSGTAALTLSRPARK